MERYDIADKIGKGTYGTVFKAIDTTTKDYVALKTIDLEDEEGIPSTAIREIALLKWLKHPNIVQLQDVIHIFNKLYMVFELMELDLKHYIDVCPNGLQLITIKSLLYQLLQGLAYCHKHNILHRDLKPANLLLNRAGILKVADFGLARTFAMPVSSLKHEVITLWYRAPELLLGCVDYSTPVDIWSVGCIFAEMLTSTPLFNGSTDEAQIQLIFDACGTPYYEENAPMDDIQPASPTNHAAQQLAESKRIGNYYSTLSQWTKYKSTIYENRQMGSYKPENVVRKIDCKGDKNAADLLQRFLHLDPELRITAEQAMAHPFFQDLKSKQRRSSQHNNAQQQQAQQHAQQQFQQQQQQQQPPHGGSNNNY